MSRGPITEEEHIQVDAFAGSRISTHMNNPLPPVPAARAAMLLGITPKTLHAWRRRGYVLAIELPNGRFSIPASEIKRLSSNAVKP